MTGVAALSLENPSTSFWRMAYEEHGPAILAFLRSRAPSREDAEELLQETFVQAIRAGDRLRDRERVRAYLFTTAHNLLRNMNRRDRGSPVVPCTIEREPAADDRTDTRARLRNLCERLASLLQTMPEAHRMAFQLGVLDRTPYGEIARRTGWSLAQVKVNVYRARKRVIEGLADILPRRQELT